MEKQQTIDWLWENSGHGTRREDIEAAYAAGEAAERERWTQSIALRAMEASNAGDAVFAQALRAAENYVRALKA